jgi:hypothetical protein
MKENGLLSSRKKIRKKKSLKNRYTRRIPVAVPRMSPVIKPAIVNQFKLANMLSKNNYPG